MTQNQGKALNLPQLSDESRATQSLIAEITPVSEMLKSFPKTRYYGSKRRLLSWLYEHIGPLRFDSALDAFGGTATVSLLLRSMRKDVTYHDGFQFNRDIAYAMLSGATDQSEEDLISFCANTVPCEGVVSRNFRGLFYFDEENAWIDGFAHALRASGFTEQKQSLYRYLLYQACLKKRPFNLFHRANLNLRERRDVKRTFGNAVTWETSFSDHILKAFREINGISASAHSSLGSANILESGDVSEVKKDFDFIYLDPPYLSNNSSRNKDGYWKRYHFLEGLSDYESWERKIDRSSRIRSMREPDWFKQWSEKVSFKDRLFGLIRDCKSSVVVLSYVTDAYPSFDEIKALFDQTFTEVSIHSMEHHHALSQAKRRELLFVGKP